MSLLQSMDPWKEKKNYLNTQESREIINIYKEGKQRENGEVLMSSMNQTL